MAFRIEVACRDQMPAIVDLHVACWRHNFKGMIRQSALDSLDPAQWLERRLARVDDPGLIQLVALDGHSVLGFCTGGASREPLFSEAGEVHALFVGLQFQGQVNQCLPLRLHLRLEFQPFIFLQTLMHTQWQCDWHL